MVKTIKNTGKGREGLVGQKNGTWNVCWCSSRRRLGVYGIVPLKAKLLSCAAEGTMYLYLQRTNIYVCAYVQSVKSCYSTLWALCDNKNVQSSVILYNPYNDNTLLVIKYYTSLSCLFSASVNETKQSTLILLLVVTAGWHVLWWWEIKTPFFPSLGDDCWLVLSWLSFSTYLQCFQLRISLLLMSLKVCDKLDCNKNWEKKC